MNKALTIIGVISLSLAFLIWPKGAHELRETTMLQPAKPLPEFKLETIHGEFNNQSLTGRWSVMFFGYVDCPEICPRTLAVVRQVALQMPNFKFYFVSADPTRDNAERLAKHLAPLHHSFTGVSGQDEQIKTLARAMGVFIGVRPDDESEHMNHSGSLFIINPKGQFAGLISNPIHAEHITDDLQLIFAS